MIRRTSSTAFSKQYLRVVLGQTKTAEVSFSSSSSTAHANNGVNPVKLTSTRKESFTIPAPTWSIASLELHISHEPVSIRELHVLAKRTVLDVNRLNDTTKNQLCQDLGNMLHMIQSVQTFQERRLQHLPDDSPMKAIMNDPVQLYDVPRGVTEAPFRIDNNENSNASRAKEQQVSQSIRKSYLEQKMHRVGGHQYYEIVTAVQYTTKKK